MNVHKILFALAFALMQAACDKADSPAQTTQADTATGDKSSLTTYVDAKVESVNIGSDGLYLNLAGLGTVPMGYVLRIS